MKEGFYNKTPLVLESIDNAPEVTAAEKADQAPQTVVDVAPAQNAETTGESVFARGQERFEKSGNFLNSLKEKSGAFFAKIPQVAKAWSQRAASSAAEMSRAVAIGVLSAPELAAEGFRTAAETGGAVLEGAENLGASAMRGLDRVGESVNGGLDAATGRILDTGASIAEFMRTKKEQFDTNMRNRGEAAKEVAELAGNWSAEKATQAREKVNGGIRSATEWGANSLAAAEARRIETMNAFRQRVNQMRLTILERRAEHHEQKRQEAIREKMELMAAFA